MNILVALELSDSSSAVQLEALKYAKLLAAKVWLIHVACPDPAFVGYKAGPNCERDQVAKDYHEQHQKLHSAAEEFREMGIETVPLLIQGPTVQSILNEATKHLAELIIMGSRGHGAFYEMVVGRTSEGVLRKSTCPVLLVPAHSE